MNTTIKKEVKYYDLPRCWIYTKHKFVLHEGHRGLPYVNLEFESVLKGLNISYRNDSIVEKNGIVPVLKYWDSEFYEEEEVELPVYCILTPNTYYYAERNHIGMIPTEETIKKAYNNIVDRILKEISLMKEQEKNLMQFNKINKILNGRISAFIHDYEICKSKEIICEVGNEKIVVFPVQRIGRNEDIKYYADRNVAFKLSSIKQSIFSTIITLEVPKGEAGIVIGRNGWQVREWAKKIRVKRINVVEV